MRLLGHCGALAIVQLVKPLKKDRIESVYPRKDIDKKRVIGFDSFEPQFIWGVRESKRGRYKSYVGRMKKRVRSKRCHPYSATNTNLATRSMTHALTQTSFRIRKRTSLALRLPRICHRSSFPVAAIDSFSVPRSCSCPGPPTA